MRLVALVLLLLPAARAGEETCARCHEIRGTCDTWRKSTHRTVPCQSCHSGSLLDALHRVSSHLRGQVSEQIRLRGSEVPKMVERCRTCHRQEFADWQAGPHGATFAKLFLNPEHNRKRLLRDDCLRCHGAFFPGGIRDLVAPLDTRGPWKLMAAEWANAPAMPCLACHQIHREGSPLQRPGTPAASAGQELFRPSLALFDRRELLPIPVARLSLPAMLDQDRPVRLSPDPRQALCYQCHAPLATRQVASGDDRTGIGVHEGISCLGCHLKHGQQTRASCASCHPRRSNCGLDVEKMDTTFRSLTSKHNIHFVKCADCHPRGVPQKKPADLRTSR